MIDTSQQEHCITWVDLSWECSCGLVFPEDSSAYDHYAEAVESQNRRPIRGVATEMELGAEGQLPVEANYSGA